MLIKLNISIIFKHMDFYSNISIIFCTAQFMVNNKQKKLL